MNLAQDLTALIESLGVEDAATRFGRKPSTVKTWVKTQSYPMDVIQQYLDESMGEMVTSATPVAAVEAFHDQLLVDEINSLRERVNHVEAYLVQLNNSPQSSAPANPMNAPRVAWAPAGPGDGNFQSFVRPEQGVPGQTLSTPVREATTTTVIPKAVNLRPGMTPADTWLNPIPIKK